ncbi:MAG: beta-ketoacyl-[acyl-carrier-protein] synthase II [Gammaproteobacteria bacterium]|nr:beta-ketoacyl-[acyl-carrier-protein] synthase II [Gammaproteobacteria bacterium]
MRRVVVTGLGTINPLGNTVAASWRALIESKSGVTNISKFDVGDYPCKIAGSINDDLIDDKIVSTRDQRKIDRFIALGLIAAHEALNDSGFVSEEETCNRSGVMVGSGIGGLDTIYKNASVLDNKGIRKISPFFIPSSLINLLSGHISIRYNLKGPNSSPVTACATGTHAIGDSFTLIKNDKADLMVCGGAEAAICPLGIAGFSAARALCDTFNDNPSKGSRPWDKDRSGFVMGEGAGVIVLEELEHAKNRNARIYGEVKGYGMSGDAFHITKPSEDGNGGLRAMQMALKESGLNPEEIKYVNAHGTSTQVGDVIELSAVEKLFSSNKDMYMSSNKSAIGHLLGAAGAVEAVFSFKSLETKILPPTLNLDNPDTLTNINLIPHEPISQSVDNIISNSFGFGGTNASLIFGN